MALLNPSKRVLACGAFTLIEVLIVVAIVGILAAISVNGFGAFATRSGADASARVVLSALEEARARTLSAEGGTSYGVHFGSTTVTVFAGETYDAGDTSNEVRTLRRAEISSVSLTGGANTIVFARLIGTASATGTVTVVQSVDVTLSRTITIHESGLSDVQ